MRPGDLDHLLLKLDAELCDDARYIDIRDQISDIVENEPTVDTFTIDDMKKGINVGYKAGRLLEKWERPQGEWSLNNDGNPECPFCHSSFTYWGNFCGNCGSDMRKVVKNNEDSQL